MSEWQMPAKWTSISTSPGPTGRRSIVVRRKPESAETASRAGTVVMGCSCRGADDARRRSRGGGRGARGRSAGTAGAGPMRSPGVGDELVGPGAHLGVVGVAVEHQLIGPGELDDLLEVGDHPLGRADRRDGEVLLH